MNTAHFDYWPEKLPPSVTVPVTNLCENLAVSAARYPEITAIDFYGHEIAYAQLWERVERFAGYLREQCGVKPGDRVLIDMQNSPAFVVAYYGILRADAVVVPVNPMNLADEIEWFAQDTGARVACIAQEFLAVFETLAERMPLEHVVVATYADDLAAEPMGVVPEVVAAARQPLPAGSYTDMAQALTHNRITGPTTRSGQDLAVIVYTSGTTGQAKGCMLSHYALNANLVAHAYWESWYPGCVALSTAPFFHVTGMEGMMNVPLFTGSTMVIMSRWDRKLAAELISQRGITHWINIPTMVIDLLNLPDIETVDFSRLVFMGGGGAAMPEAVATRLRELAGLDYLEGWGLTEVAGGIHFNPPGNPKRQCLGIPLFDVDTEIVDIATLRPVGDNEHGEIVTCCPSLFSGYWNNPQATEEAFVTLNGQRYFRTGDIGYRDSDGYYFMADRLKRMINTSGFKVWPSEVESILYRHPGIQEVCVIAVSDPQKGEQVKALVVRAVASDELTEEGLMLWARENIAAYKIPRVIEFIDELPKSASGKVLWRNLQDRENNQ